MDSWLNEDLKKKIRKVFEPRYKRILTEDEVVSIANNLVALMETYAKYRWRNEYGQAAR